MRGRRRMRGEVVERRMHRGKLRARAVGGAQHRLGAGLGHAGAVVEPRIGVMHQPGQQRRELPHIALPIRAIHAQRVQFEKFAREIFVQPPPLPLPGRAVGPHRPALVEVVEHHRMGGSRAQHVGKAAGQVRPDRFFDIRRHQMPAKGVARAHGEMIGPEERQPFAKAVGRHDPARERGVEMHRALVAGTQADLLKGGFCRGLLRCAQRRTARAAEAAKGAQRRRGGAERRNRMRLRGPIGPDQRRQHRARVARGRMARRQAGAKADRGKGRVKGHGRAFQRCLSQIGARRPLVSPSRTAQAPYRRAVLDLGRQDAQAQFAQLLVARL